LVFAQDNGHGFKVYPEHIWAGTDPFENPERLNPTVTGGPYTIETWEKGQYILLKRNPDYYLEPFPFVDYVLLKLMSDPDTIWSALLADELDSITYEMAPAYPVQKLVMQGAYPGIDLWHTGSIYSYPLKINHEHPILSNKLVRKGIATAIDRDEIVTKGFHGVWPANYHYAHEGSIWENPDAKAPSFDKEEAENLLDEAGYPRQSNGWRFELDLTAMPVTAPMTSAEIIKEQLEAVGIKINYELFDQPTAEQMIRDGDFALVTEWTRYGPSPNDGYYACWHSEGRYNMGRFRFYNEEYDSLIEEALTIMDMDERKELFWDAQEILAEEVAEIPIVYEQKNLIGRSEWHGMNARPDGWGVNGNWWGNRAVWSEEYVEDTGEPQEITELRNELELLSTRLEATSEGLASGLNNIADSMDTLSGQISDSNEDISALDERIDKMMSTMSMLQTIAIVTLLAVIIAVAIPFVRKQ
jgi:peptide/nickel transport system substrate-binding protein